MSHIKRLTTDQKDTFRNLLHLLYIVHHVNTTYPCTYRFVHIITSAIPLVRNNQTHYNKLNKNPKPVVTATPGVTQTRREPRDPHSSGIQDFLCIQSVLTSKISCKQARHWKNCKLQNALHRKILTECTYPQEEA